MRYYTGVGSRETPKDICDLMTQIATFLSSSGWTLRSGHAPGADIAFEDGATRANIYLPWFRFNGSESPHYSICDRAYAMARLVHPAWDRCSAAAKKLHARNVYQVHGHLFTEPSKMLICWTKDGMPTGGTATAIRLAEMADIPVFNLYHKDTRDHVIEQMSLKA